MTTMAAVQCAAAAPSDPSESSLLWRIESSEGAVSHLFGTIHLPDSTVFRQRDTVLRILESSRTFYGELDLDSANSPLLAMKLMLPAGTTLADLYEPDDYEQIRSALQERLGPMAAMAERMKPAAILGLMMMQEAEATAPTSIDQYLWDLAGRQGLDRFGLERLDEQLSVLDEMPPHLLLEAIEAPETEDSLAQALVDAYSREDIGVIARLVDSLSAVETFMQQLNDDRNEVMVDRLRDQLADGDLFIAVGAAHLPGDTGLIGRLRADGYVVTPVVGGNPHTVVVNGYVRPHQTDDWALNIREDLPNDRIQIALGLNRQLDGLGIAPSQGDHDGNPTVPAGLEYEPITSHQSIVRQR